MPLRDHFRPPISKHWSWEGFHGGWPMAMVQQFAPLLPPGFIAEPRVHLGQSYEIDVNTYEDYSETDSYSDGNFSPTNGGDATATLSPPEPLLSLETEFLEEYAYEVLVFDLNRERELVAAIEIVSPANKDRPESRQMFVSKCLSLLQKGVCVSIVDVVTIRNYNLYVELLHAKGLQDDKFVRDIPPTYAATCRKRSTEAKTVLDLTAFPLKVGEPLPALPIWLNDDQSVTLDLEKSYEAVCEVFRIPPVAKTTSA